MKTYLKSKTNSVNFLLSFCFFTTCFNCQNIFGQTAIGKYAFDGNVYAIKSDKSNNTYIGGDFTRIGVYSGSGVYVDRLSDSVNLNYPKIEGEVKDVVSIPGGGWYVCGRFFSVDGQPRSNLARINADGSLHPFHPIFEGWSVNTMEISSTGDLYIGGFFSSIDGNTRLCLAAFDNLGNLKSFQPNVYGGTLNGVLDIIFDSNSYLYIGGDIEVNIGYTISDFVKLDTLGNIYPLNLNLNGMVNKIYINSSEEIYLGGRFTTVNGIQRNYLAKIDTLGNLNSFNPNFNNWVVDIDRDNLNNLFVTGFFTKVSGIFRTYIAQFDNNDNLTTLDLGLDSVNTPSGFIGFVNFVSHDLSNNIYFSGGLEVENGLVKSKFLKYNTLYNPVNSELSFDDHVNSLAHDAAGNLFFGGQFRSVYAQNRYCLAKLDNNDVLTNFNPNFNSAVLALATDDDENLYVGGRFTSAGGGFYNRNKFAKYDKNGVISSFAPYISQFYPYNGAHVNAIAIDHQKNIYIGGAFFESSDVPTQNLVKFDSLGNTTTFDAKISSEVFALAIDVVDNIHIGGAFVSSANGYSKHNYAQFDKNGNSISFNPILNGYVSSINVDQSGNLYLGGNFTSVNNVTSNKIVKFDYLGNITSGSNDLGFNSLVTSLATDEAVNLFVGGTFKEVASMFPKKYFATFTNSGMLNSFDAFQNYFDTSYANTEYIRINAISLNNGKIYIGGSKELYKPFEIYDYPTLSLSKNLSSENQDQIIIYPNPSKGKFKLLLQSSNNLKINSIYVSDMLGKIVFQNNLLNGKESEIELYNLPKGVYNVKVATSGTCFVEKIVIE